MVKKIVQVDVKSKGAGELDKDLKSIDKNLKSIDKAAEKAFKDDDLKKFKNESQNTVKAVKSVTTRLRELEDEMAGIGDVGSPQFQKLAKEAGTLKDRINNAKAATRSLSSDFPKLQIGVEAFSAIGGAAQGAVGVTQLLGSENEAVTQGIQKMMAIQSLLNGVNAVANALSDETALGLKLRAINTKILTAAQLRNAGATTGVTIAQKGLAAAQLIGTSVMKGLNAVMNRNPIFLLIGLFTALAGAIAWFSSDSETAAEKSEKLNESMEKQSKLMEKLFKLSAKLHDNRMRQLKLEDASEEELHKARIDRLKQMEVERRVELKNLKEGYKKKAKLYHETLEEEDYESAKSQREQIDRDKARITELRNNSQDFDLSRREENKKYSKFLEKEEKARTDKFKQQMTQRSNAHKKYLSDRLKAERRIQDLQDQLSNDEIASNNLKYSRLIEDTKADQTLLEEEKTAIIEKYEALREDKEASILTLRKTKRLEEIAKLDAEEAAKLQAEYDRQDEQFKLLNDLRNTEREAEIAAIVSDYEAKFELAVGNKELELELEQSMSEEINAIKDADAQKEAERAKDSFNVKLQTAKDYAQSVNSLAELVFTISNSMGKQGEKEAEKRARRQFNVQKAMNLSMAVIDGFKAITASLSQSPLAIGPLPSPAGIASLTAAATKTGTSITSIAASKFQSSGSGGSIGGLGSAPSLGGGGTQSLPAQFNVVGDTGVNQLAESLSGGAPVKAYVVASDVTTQQGLDRNQLENATL